MRGPHAWYTVRSTPRSRASLAAQLSACGPRVRVAQPLDIVRTVTCPVGTILLGGGTSVLDPQAPMRSVLL